MTASTSPDSLEEASCEDFWVTQGEKRPARDQSKGTGFPPTLEASDAFEIRSFKTRDGGMIHRGSQKFNQAEQLHSEKNLSVVTSTPY